jgi:hypothetical protein
MKIAIMQPYFLPYIGYFQLINAVDTFVFCDDVPFIKGGFINRNHILVNREKYRFTIPVQDVHFRTTIKETIVANNPRNWSQQLVKTLQQYQKAPYFDAVFPFMVQILRGSIGRPISDVAIESIQNVLNYIDVKKRTSTSFGQYNNTHLKGADRIIDICRQEKANIYINAIGGQRFLNKDYFSDSTIQLQFLKPNLATYAQNTPNFIAGLSILDVLMYNNPVTVKAMLSNYTLV